MTADPEGPLSQATNVLVSLLGGAFGAVLLSQPADPPRAWLGVFFVLFGAAFLIAAVAHARAKRRGSKEPLTWAATLILTALAFAALNAADHARYTAGFLSIGAAWVFAISAAVPAALYLVVARARAEWPWDRVGWLSVRLHGSAIALLSLALLFASLLTGSRSAALRMGGIAVGLAGLLAQSALKRARRNLGPLDWNSVFHLVMAAAFALYFAGALRQG
jgi:hypothetical protein